MLANPTNSTKLEQTTTLQEVGEESKLARSIERIRSLIRSKRNKENEDNQCNSKLEQIVREVQLVAAAKKAAAAAAQAETQLHRLSYQVKIFRIFRQITQEHL